MNTVDFFRLRDWDDYYMQVDYDNADNRFLYNATTKKFMDVTKYWELATDVLLQWNQITETEYKQATGS